MYLTAVFPFADLAILAGLAAVLLQRESITCDRALRILTLGTLAYIVGDVMFARLAARGDYIVGNLPDVLWVAASWLFALAAQERWRQDKAPGVLDRERTPGIHARSLSLVPYVGVAGGYAFLLLVAIESGERSLMAPIAGAVALTLCVVAGQVLALRENASLLAEQARRQSEARFSSLVCHLQDIVAILDADGALAYISPSVQRLLGRCRSAFRA